MIIYSYPTEAEAAEQAAGLIVEAALDALDSRGEFTIALSGGSTPRRIYEELADCDRLTDEMLAKTHFFWGDERAVGSNHADSNVRMALDSLLNPRKVPRANIHMPKGGAENLGAEALRYEIEIKRTVRLGSSGFPCFDLVLLGIGTDGHTASLFPGTAALDDNVRTFVDNDVPALQARRLTLTFNAINSASNIMVVAPGRKKAEVLKDVFTRNGKAPVYPIERVRGNGSNIVWITDAAGVSMFSDEQLEQFGIRN